MKFKKGQMLYGYTGHGHKSHLIILLDNISNSSKIEQIRLCNFTSSYVPEHITTLSVPGKVLKDEWFKGHNKEISKLRYDSHQIIYSSQLDQFKSFNNICSEPELRKIICDESSPEIYRNELCDCET